MASWWAERYVVELLEEHVRKRDGFNLSLNEYNDMKNEHQILFHNTVRLEHLLSNKEDLANELLKTCNTLVVKQFIGKLKQVKTDTTKGKIEYLDDCQDFQFFKQHTYDELSRKHSKSWNSSYKNASDSQKIATYDNFIGDFTRLNDYITERWARLKHCISIMERMLVDSFEYNLLLDEKTTEIDTIIGNITTYQCPSIPNQFKLDQPVENPSPFETKLEEGLDMLDDNIKSFDFDHDPDEYFSANDDFEHSDEDDDMGDVIQTFPASMWVNTLSGEVELIHDQTHNHEYRETSDEAYFSPLSSPRDSDSTLDSTFSVTSESSDHDIRLSTVDTIPLHDTENQIHGHVSVTTQGHIIFKPDTKNKTLVKMFMHLWRVVRIAGTFGWIIGRIASIKIHKYMKSLNFQTVLRLGSSVIRRIILPVVRGGYRLIRTMISNTNKGIKWFAITLFIVDTQLIDTVPMKCPDSHPYYCNDVVADGYFANRKWRCVQKKEHCQNYQMRLINSGPKIWRKACIPDDDPKNTKQTRKCRSSVK